jgi:hypothetical protein
MADQPALPPNVATFKKKLDAKTALKAERDQLEKWRQSKCPPELHGVVDELIARWDSGRATIEAAQKQAQARVYAEPPVSHGRAPQKGENATAAAPSKIGEPFHNPYTFIPFGTKPIRSAPTLLTADEDDTSRFTGVLRLRIRTLSPLLTCMPTATEGVHAVTAIGDDVIVPATGVRGALRTLMTVLTGGTLGYVDPMLWLTQGRDLNLGPRGMNSPSNTPERVFLARVVEPGGPTRPGRVELNAAADPLITVQALTPMLPGIDGLRPKPSKRRDQERRGSVPLGGGETIARLSGKPIKPAGKREGLFKPSGKTIELKPELWEAFIGRHAHADFKELKAGDLVWLEPRTMTLDQIRDGNDVASIQWSRWGRRGERLLDAIRKRHGAVLPDSLREDGLVDEVTNLFGHIPDRHAKQAAAAFAGRIRPDNLVFRDAARTRVDRGVQLAPLMQPHPGCIGFYRDNRDLDQISQSDPLRGYKVYRTTRERGTTAPWHYATQGVYGEYGALELPGAVSRKCDLLHDGLEGELTISLRALSKRELALLLTACSVDWRLGGGKPLGLGHCRVMHAELLNEFGASQCRWIASEEQEPDRDAPAPLPTQYADGVDPSLSDRARIYQATQRPVQRLRYPRAVKPNDQKSNRGGQVWFQRHASPKKAQDKHEQRPIGLQVFRVTADLATSVGATQVKAQRLPDFDPKNPFADVLYGYDCWTDDTGGHHSMARSIAPFDPTKHARANERSGGHQGQSRETRQAERDRR